VAAHSFGASITAMLLADKLLARGVAIDVARLLRIALIHDWAETRVGDMPKTATEYFGAETRKRAETAAFAEIVKGMGTAEFYCEMYNEYELRGSLEARLVKAADVIDLLVQALALERAGAHGLDEFWEVVPQANFQLEGPADDMVRELLQSLVSARPKLGMGNK
jgi:putative hydrolases of HD superfamily